MDPLINGNVELIVPLKGFQDYFTYLYKYIELFFISIKYMLQLHSNLYQHDFHRDLFYLKLLSSQLLNKSSFLPKTDINIYSTITDL